MCVTLASRGGCKESRRTALTFPFRRPMLLACLQHSNPSFGSCLVVCVSPFCLPPRTTVESAVREYFTLGGCFGPRSEYLFRRVWWSCNDKASRRQINGSNGVMFDTLLEGTVLFLPVRRLKAKTSYRHPRWLGK